MTLSSTQQTVFFRQCLPELSWPGPLSQQGHLRSGITGSIDGQRNASANQRPIEQASENTAWHRGSMVSCTNLRQSTILSSKRREEKQRGSAYLLLRTSTLTQHSQMLLGFFPSLERKKKVSPSLTLAIPAGIALLAALFRNQCIASALRAEVACYAVRC